MNRLVVKLLGLYKRWLSPMLPAACRFTPTCSEYAALSFSKYGFWKASWLSLWRLLRCNPFNPGGLDLP